MMEAKTPADPARRPQPLPDEQVTARLGALPSWKREGDVLVREVRFASYMDGIDFVNRVAREAERMDHHPDLSISWRKVAVRLTSHDAGGITARDFALAGRIDALLGEAAQEG
jgi:4a-hydroxytetrahydrobiopterin dehydratase